MAYKKERKNTAADWTRMRQMLINHVKTWHDLHWSVTLRCSNYPLCQFSRARTMDYQRKPSQKLIKSDAREKYRFICHRIQTDKKRHQIKVEGKCRICTLVRQISDANKKPPKRA
ncbi:MAG: hypothetical protein WCT16_01895 [Candidatus Buchananbacteria bacterium]